MAVSVTGAGRARVSASWTAGWARAAAKALRRGADDVAVVYLDAREIRRLNRSYRRRDEATDTLSFPAGRREDLGDVFICPGVAAKKAKIRDLGYREYLALLIVHGVLHLGGHDHRTKKESSAMGRQEEKILSKKR